jgi:hypothetical protein
MVFGPQRKRRILIGILLARTVAGFVGTWFGWRLSQVKSESAIGRVSAK